MKATKIKHFLRSTLIFSVLLMFVSCSNLFEHNIENDSEPAKADNKTYLKISYNANNSGRTIFPAQISQEYLTSPVLYGIAEGDSEKKVFDLMASSLIEILPGKWTFTLTAIYEYISEPGADPLSVPFTDTVTVNIVQGQSNTVVFNLKPQGDAGGIKLHLDLSSEANIDSVKVTLKNISGSTIKSDNLDMSDKSDVLFTHTNLKAGTYFIHYDFFTGNDPTPVNQWESYVKILPPFLTEADISMNFNSVYTISFQDESGNDFDFEHETFEGLVIKHFSARSSFDLPTGLTPPSDKVFIGWRDATMSQEMATPITQITPGQSGDLTLLPFFAEPTLYVSSDGDDTDHGFNSSSSLKTISKACEIIQTYGHSTAPWTIKISGIFKGGSGTNEYAQCLFPSTITTAHAKSIELTGATGLDGYGIPQDIIDRGLTAINGAPSTGSAVKIETSVPVTITNLEITKGFHTYGAGMNIAQGATVILGDGVRIIGNTTGSGNGRGGGIHNEGTLFMYGSAVVGNDKATQNAVGSSMNSYLYNYANPADTQRNGNYGDLGAGIYNGTGATNNTVEAKIYLGYSGFDTDGVTPVEATLTGGIYANGASAGGGIYNQQNCTVYYHSGNIKYNAGGGYGGGIDNFGLVKMCGENAKLINNTAGSGGGLYNETNGRFLMSDGQINNNSATNTGGGICNVSDCYLYGNAIVGDKTATAAATETTHGNTARNGGGISTNNGNLYVGYKPDGTVDTSYTTNGGIYYNFATGTGSSDSYGGGAIYSTGSNRKGFTFVAAGTLAYNSSGGYAGGIYVGGELVEISGGTIENNLAEKGGGAISYNSSYHGFAMKDNPSIPKGADNKNDILLTVGADITITGTLGANTNAYYLSFSPYIRTAPVLLIGEGAGTTIADEYQKFEIAPYTITDQNGNQHNPHMILTDGTLPNGCYLIEADTWEGDLERYIGAMTDSGTVRVGGAITRNLAQTVMTALESKPSDFRLSLDLSKATGWSDSMPSFEGCTRLKDFAFPKTVSSMRLDAYNNGNLFKDCTNLESVTIPVSVRDIYSNFDGCSSLTDVYYMGTESQKTANIRFPTMTKNGVPTQEKIISNIEPIDPDRPVIWHYLGYDYTITIDTGTDSDIAVSVTDGNSTITDIATINKGTPLTFTVNSSEYTTFKWKVDGTVQSETSSLNVDTSNWAIGATYTISLIAADDSGNEDSYFAHITVTE